MSFLVGAGSVYSTPRDLHRMMQAVLNNRLGETAKTALLKDKGFDWNGISNGFRAFADYDKETGFQVIFAGNFHLGSADRIRENLPRLLAGEIVPPPEPPKVTPMPVDVATLERYEGTFQDRPQPDDHAQGHRWLPLRRRSAYDSYFANDVLRASRPRKDQDSLRWLGPHRGTRLGMEGYRLALDAG
jgi:hypothetical protein